MIFIGVVVCGLISFIGFVVLYMMCSIIGGCYCRLLFVLVLIGVLLLVVVDLLVRIIYFLLEFLVGVLIVIIGVLWFVWLFVRM